MTLLYLLRHGESAWNDVGRYQGRLDTPLSELGQHQAATIAEHLRPVPLDAIYSSPLRRALDTALVIAAGRPLEVHIEPDLVEIDHGHWNGLLREEVAQRYGSLLRLWQERPSLAQMPAGENLRQVSLRATEAIQRIAQGHPEGTVLVCTHDAVLRTILCWALGLDLDHLWSLGTENASLSLIEVVNQEVRLLQLNDTCYLGPLRSDLSSQAL